MLRRVQQTLMERKLIRPGMTLLAGVSGGADSVAMLYALWFLQSRLNFRVVAAHLHHGLRGIEADEDEASVLQLGGKLGIPVLTAREQVARTRQRPGISFEMAARAARHDFFLTVVAKTNADAVALAHTRNDQAETVLMRVLTGTGIEGLGGMDYRSEPCPGLKIIRPMLDVSREAIESFLLFHGLSWREDATNNDPRYHRNRIRHQIMPSIAQQGFGQIADALIRLADVSREEAKLLEDRTCRLLSRCREGGNGHALRLERLRRLPIADQRRVVRRWLKESGVGERDMGFAFIERIRSGFDRVGHKTIQIHQHLAVHIDASTVQLVRNTSAAQTLATTRLTIPGETTLEELDLVVSVTPSQGYRTNPQRIGLWPVDVYLRRDEGEVPVFLIRGRLPGDAYRPTGMKGQVSVKDLLMNEKVPKSQRGGIPLVVCGGHVVWVAGHRVDQQWAVVSPQAPSWHIVIRKR